MSDEIVDIELSDEPEATKRGPSQATVLIQTVQEFAEFFHDAHGSAYATFTVGDHRETWALRSRAFRSYLERTFFESEGKAPSAQAIQDAIGVMDGEARFAGAEHPVHVRVAGDDEVVHLDLGGPTWSSVVVTRDGWAITQCPAVKFRRPRGMAALPMPSESGDLARLQALVNVADRDWPLLLGWMIGALRPAGPFPVLASFGEQGSAKSTTQRIVRTMFDPSTAPLRSAPRNEHELVIAARNNYVIGFDNASTIQPWLSDAFARIATGAGFAARELYSDGEETIFAEKRPVLLNGIEEVVSRPDLLDRALIIEHPRISPTQRATESDVWEAVSAAHPLILGGLLDALVAALRNLDEVELEELPRMADFCKWVTSAEPVLGWEPGRFFDAYADNRDSAHDVALEASPIVATIRNVADVGFEGSASDLLALLNESAEDATLRLRSWPKSASALSGSLRRLAPNLREIGISIDFERAGKSRKRIVAIHKIEAVKERPPRPPRPLGLNKPSEADGADRADGDDGQERPPDTAWTSEADGADEADGDLRLQSAEPSLEDAVLSDAAADALAAAVDGEWITTGEGSR